jgi:hypothetical protein
MKIHVPMLAKGGHLESLKYLHDKGCLWNEWTCNSAAKAGHLEILKWAHDAGCRLRLE